ncbi:MAG: ribosome maturation factor RimM [Bacillota bacterium]
MDKKRDIAVGKIVGTHGNRGLLKVLPLTDYPDRFWDMKSVTLELGGKQHTYTVAGVSRHRGHILLGLGEVSDMNGAEKLRGAMIMVARDELTPLPVDSYYIFDIIGLQVYTPEGRRLGVVEDVIRTGANDVYVVNAGGKEQLLIPALKEVVTKVDIGGGRMEVVFKC